MLVRPGPLKPNSIRFGDIKIAKRVLSIHGMKTKSGPPAMNHLNAQMYMPAHRRFIDSCVECIEYYASPYAVFKLLDASHVPEWVRYS